MIIRYGAIDHLSIITLYIHFSSVTFGISIALTALSFVTERKEGLLDRTWVAGVNVTEMVISQVLTQFFILLVQIFLLVIIVKFAFKVFGLSNTGFCY